MFLVHLYAESLPITTFFRILFQKICVLHISWEGVYSKKYREVEGFQLIFDSIFEKSLKPQ